MSRTPDPVLAERRRRQILDAALACFGRRGFHETSMQEICAEAGLSPGAVYRYFPSKADIIAAIVDDDHSGIDACFEAISSGKDAVDSLTVLARTFVARCEAQSSLAAHILSEALRDDRLASRLAIGRQLIEDRLTAVLEQGAARGTIQLALPARQTARTLGFLLDGLFINVATRMRPDLDTLVDDFRALLVRLFPPAPTPRPAGRRRPNVLVPGADR